MAQTNRSNNKNSNNSKEKKTKKPNIVYRSWVGVERFFKMYFKNFKSLLIANLVFAVPLAVGFLAAFLISNSTPALYGNIFIWFIPIIIAMPFYPAILQVCRDIMSGKQVNGIKTVLKGLKNNIKPFILHGFVFYLAALISYLSIAFYSAAAGVNSMMYVILGICVVISLYMLFIFYLVPLITVTLDIKMRYVYKNAALMSIMETPRCILVTVDLVLLALAVSTIFLFTPNRTVIIVILAVLAATILPSMVGFITTYCLYNRVEAVLIKEDEGAEKLEESEVQAQKDEQKRLEEEQLREDAKKIIDDVKNSRDEYVYHNGRMIKRSLLLEKYSDEDDD